MLGASVPRCVVVLLVTAALAALPAPASAQIRGFADIGSTMFAAEESFRTIFGTARGVVFGGGVEAVLPFDLFVGLRASRVRKEGERVFLFQGEPFGLGVPTRVTVTPIEVTGGYRLARWQRVIPYGGGGFGFHRYKESSDFAQPGEDVDDTFTGYHVLGGVEFRVSRLVGAAGELQWSTVPDALGQDPNGVSRAFDETDLGGVTVRVKIVVGL